MIKRYPLQPDYATSPGGTIAESLEMLGLTPQNLATQTTSPLPYVTAVLEGQTPITPEFAQALTQVIDVPADFWLKMDANYQAWLLKSGE